MRRGLSSALSLGLAVVVIGALWRSSRPDAHPTEQALAKPTPKTNDDLLPTPLQAKIESESIQASVETGWTFRGQVLDSERKPLRGFGVVAARLGDDGAVLERIEQPLDDHRDGRFDVPCKSAGHWRIEPFAPGRQLVMGRDFWQSDSEIWTYQLLLQENLDRIAELMKEPEPATIEGEVVVPSGALPPSILVEALVCRELWTGPGDRVVASATCDEAGRFTLRADAGVLKLRASTAGWNDSEFVERSLQEGESSTATLALRPPTPVSLLIEPLDPSNPRPLHLEWTAEGKPTAGADGVEGAWLDTSIVGEGWVLWSLACGGDAPLRGSFHLAVGERRRTELHRFPARPMVLSVTGFDADTPLVALACEAAMGLTSAANSSFVNGRHEFTLPRPGKWLITHAKSEFASGYFNVVEVPAVARHAIEFQPPPRGCFDY